MINIKEAALALSMGGTLSFFDEHCFTSSRISPQTWILPAYGVPNGLFFQLLAISSKRVFATKRGHHSEPGFDPGLGLSRYLIEKTLAKSLHKYTESGYSSEVARGGGGGRIAPCFAC
jgi:hypothetical protein